MSRKEGHKEITRTPNTTSSAGNTVHPHTIGACVAVLLGFLLLGAVVFIICRRRRSRRTSATTREPATDGSKQPTVVEGSPNRRDTEDPGLDDHSSIEGAEGMQYSTLEFKKSGEHSFSEAPAVIYAEIPTSK
ncbi:uncharacterized protein LOC128347322 isoform X2 [Hemicordylus capensis]|nr:uncharacterized protein LOC128347322 isoform X2 [Hemicordylus capensis]